VPDKYQINYNEITMNEKRFARRVIYQLRAQNPPPMWHNLIPFKFALEYIRIRRAIRIFEKNAMVVRKLALDAAKSMLEGNNPEIVSKMTSLKIREWLIENDFNYDPVHENQVLLARSYENHFSTLLQAEGKGYEALVRAVYRIPPRYREFFDWIGSMEKQFDDMICELTLETEEEKQNCIMRMKNSQQAYDKARDMELRRVFER
jgi:hypothetical protein